MVTDSSEAKEWGGHITTGQVYVRPCDGGAEYGEAGKHRILVGEKHLILINCYGISEKGSERTVVRE